MVQDLIIYSVYFVDRRTVETGGIDYGYIINYGGENIE